MMGDPAKAYERVEFERVEREERMGQKLKSVSDAVQRDMHQWGDWARRGQFWENLRVTPFCKLLGLSFGGDAPDVRLDPQSMAIHKAVMLLDDDFKIVVFAYFVARVWHEDRPALFDGHGISRATYYRRLSAGTVMAHNRAMRWLEHEKNNCETIQRVI